MEYKLHYIEDIFNKNLEREKFDLGFDMFKNVLPGVISIVGRHFVGKTTFMLNSALNLVSKDMPILFISTSDRINLVKKLIALESYNYENKINVDEMNHLEKIECYKEIENKLSMHSIAFIDNVDEDFMASELLEALNSIDRDPLVPMAVFIDVNYRMINDDFKEFSKIARKNNLLILVSIKPPRNYDRKRVNALYGNLLTKTFGEELLDKSDAVLYLTNSSKKLIDYNVMRGVSIKELFIHTIYNNFGYCGCFQYRIDTRYQKISKFY